MNEVVKLIVELKDRIAACVAADDKDDETAAINAGVDLDDFVMEHGAELILVLGAVTGTAHDDVELRECNACDWKGPRSATVMCGSIGPLCPKCKETTE